jgi:gliding motility-associated-like protein
MKTTYILFSFVLLFSTASFGFNGPKHKANFNEKDIFQSARFLKNVSGLYPDYNGQAIRYFASHDGVTVYLTDAGPVYKVATPDEKKIAGQKKERAHDKGKGEDDENRTIPYRLSYATVKWIGANPHPVIEASAKNTGYYSYLAGSPATKDAHSILTDGYGTLTYRDLYPGIDVVYSFPDRGGMKYDLIVHPGADASRIRMEYGGGVKKISKDKDGNILAHTATGDIMEHTPISYMDNGAAVASAYQINGTTVTFSLPGGYDHTHTLTIDPWVSVLTQLVVRNLGTSVDYDLTGNLYVYGAGAQDLNDVNNNQKLAKFDVSGNFLWVFMGSVPSISWVTSYGSAENYLGNAKVDRVSDKTYMGQGFNYTGNQTIRLDASGVYDNFASVPTQNFQEAWSYISDCQTGAILALGGGTSSNLNMGVINPTSGIVSTSNFTNITGSNFQDVVSGAYDAFGNLYLVMASLSTPAVDNYLFKCNSSYTSNIWNLPTGYLTFDESDNLPLFDIDGTNNFNALAANSSYLYYYDGSNLAAYSFTNGSTLGSTTILGYVVKYQGGIAVDNCNHLYLGGQGVIKTFTFNGTTFTAGADIPLGTGFTNTHLTDVRYDASSNLLYVTGDGIVGTYNATLSTNCTAVVNTLTATVTASCGRAIVHVTPGVGLSSPVFSFLWEDSAGNILRQTVPDSILVDTLSGIGAGHYVVQVQLNVNCGGATFIDSFAVVCNSLTHTPDTTICAGQSATLSAHGFPYGGTYSWAPGGSTDSTITVTPAATTTYIVTYTPLTGPAMTDSIKVTVVNATTVSVTDTSRICSGQNATLTATPTVGGGTYLWTPGGATTQSITVGPAANTEYTVTYSTATCGSATDSGIVIIAPAPALTVTSATICAGGTATIKATPNIGGGTYSWSPGGATTDSITVSPAGTTTYTVIYTTSGCGSATATGTVNITAGPTVTVSDTSVCQGQAATLTATPSASGGTYSWSPGGAGTQSITASPATSSQYTVTYSLAGCSPVTASGNINIFQSISVSLSPVNPGCPDSINGQVITTINPAGTYHYHWSNNDSSQNISDVSAGTYLLTVTDANGCAYADSTILTAPAAASLFIMPSDTTVIEGDTIGLFSIFGGYAGTAVTSYAWTPALGLSCNNCAGPLVYSTLFADSINYDTLTVIYNNGCVVTAYDTIRIRYTPELAIPNAFSPNGDSRNDVFFIPAKDVATFSMRIYNRWGQEIFSSTDISQGWDGNYKGKPQPVGDYLFFFNISYETGKAESHNGTVTLFR